MGSNMIQIFSDSKPSRLESKGRFWVVTLCTSPHGDIIVADSKWTPSDPKIWKKRNWIPRSRLGSKGDYSLMAILLGLTKMD